MSAENRTLALRARDIVNQRNPALIEELYPPAFVCHGPDQDIRTYEQAEQSATMFLAAFSDAHITNEDVIAEGDKVARRYTTRGTHQGETQMFGPPTGRQIEQKGITIHRIEDGKIVEEWEIFDTLSMLKQLGLAPEQ
jgi:predicted ester cyclase